MMLVFDPKMEPFNREAFDTLFEILVRGHFEADTSNDKATDPPPRGFDILRYDSNGIYRSKAT